MNILFLDWPCFGRTDFLNFFSERHDSVTLFSHADYELRKSDSFLAALYSVLENQQFDFCFSYNFFPLMATACYKCNINTFLLSMTVHKSNYILILSHTLLIIFFYLTVLW